MNRYEEITERRGFRQAVVDVVELGNSHGYRLIVHNALRTPEQQSDLLEKGWAHRLCKGYIAGSDGFASACDIVDARFLWGAPRHVWIMVGRLAMTRGCKWGGLYGLPRRVRRKLTEFLLDRSRPFDPKEWRGPIGWAPAYIGMGNTLAKAEPKAVTEGGEGQDV